MWSECIIDFCISRPPLSEIELSNNMTILYQIASAMASITYNTIVAFFK